MNFNVRNGFVKVKVYFCEAYALSCEILFINSKCNVNRKSERS
jgi:hypothetical protein